MTIRDRILARPDLAGLRAVRDIYGLADGLNQECVPTMVPAYVTAVQILDLAPYSNVMYDLLTAAANGESIAFQAAALLSPEGLNVPVPGYEPPFVTAEEVNEAMFNPDGSEK
jgi:hypothetical protein